MLPYPGFLASATSSRTKDMESLEKLAYDLLDKGLIPDRIQRLAVRHLSNIRLCSLPSPQNVSFSVSHAAKLAFIEDLKSRPIAEQTSKANEQHYEVSTPFMMSTLGPRAKYSSCLFEEGKEEGSIGKDTGMSIKQAEERMMNRYCEKAKMQDGLDVLDLGCGWGSLTLFLAEKYPKSRITGLSNSSTQKEHILGVAKERGLTNVEVITADVNTHEFSEDKTFDRIFSIEMFEHMKNYEALLQKCSKWLRPKTEDREDSLLFVHIFCHKTTPYHFENDNGWMAQMFFSGGTMPSFDLFTYFQSDVTLLKSWYINGTHYGRSLESWLRLQDRNAAAGLEELQRDAVSKGIDPVEGRKAFYRFRTFYLACAEFFAMNRGDEWGVGHYLFKRKD